MATQGMKPYSVDPKFLQLHLEEYKALVHKSAALISQMFTFMAIGFVYLGYIINNWKPSFPDHRPQLWPGLLVEQVIITFWLALRHTELGIAVYIDTQLRALCEPEEELRSTFWQYGVSLDGHTAFLSKLSLCLPLLTSSGAFVGVLIYRCWFLKIPWSKWDSLAIAAAVGLLSWTLVGTLRMFKLSNRRKKNPTHGQHE